MKTSNRKPRPYKYDYTDLINELKKGKALTSEEVMALCPAERKCCSVLEIIDRLNLPIWNPTNKTWKLLTQEDMDQYGR